GADLRQALQPLLGRNADHRQRVVQKSVDRLIDPLPDDRGAEERSREGKEVHRRPHVPPFEAGYPIETERDGERKNDRRRHGEQQQLDGIADGGPEGGVGQDLFIKAQADELARSSRRDLVERIHDGLRERQQVDGTEEQQRGQNEQKSGTLATIVVVLRKSEAIPLAHGRKG